MIMELPIPNKHNMAKSEEIKHAVLAYPTKSKWTLRYHEVDNGCWRDNDYVLRYSITSLEDFWEVFNNVDQVGYFKNKDYFIMRDKIKPVWEDVKNKNNIIVSIQIPDEIFVDTITLLTGLVIGETFVKDNHLINGISIKYTNEQNNMKRLSHKKKAIFVKRPNFGLLKIWTNNKTPEFLDGGLKIFLNKLIPKYVNESYADFTYKIVYKKMTPEY